MYGKHFMFIIIENIIVLIDFHCYMYDFFKDELSMGCIHWPRKLKLFHFTPLIYKQHDYQF